MAPGRKCKAKDAGIDAAEAKDGLSRIERKQQPPEELLYKAHRLLQPCPPACGTKGSKGSKDNPQCFCALIPPEGSYRKKGLWQKEPVLDAIGRDPAEDRRQGPDIPAGLRNLGQTCYVNAAMQFLFATPDFSRALYILEPEIAQQDIIRQLRDLCIDHHYGPRSHADPAPFATALQLNTAVQQDGQEFLKLLLQKLEHIFARSQQPEVVSVVQRLFRGYFSYVTTCLNCQHPSEGSKRVTEYYELPLQVVGMRSLHESLSCALASEELVGDNQYYCELCGKKCDAARQMRLRSLPPYLCLSLQRFVFDYQTLDKLKATDKLSIPLLLDIGQLIAATGVVLPEGAPTSPDGTLVVPEAACAQYELAAVLIHRGTSASHGHYVAHVKMPDTGIWWRFDDEVAEGMGPAPTRCPPMDHGMTAAAAAAEDGNAKGGGGRGKRAKKDGEDDGDSCDVSAASKKSRGAGVAQGRGAGKGRGRGRRGKSPGLRAHSEVAVMDEDHQLQEALRLSRENEVHEQATAWASIQQQQQNCQSDQEHQVQQQELDLCEEVTAGADARSGRQHKTAVAASAEPTTAKQGARARRKAKATSAAGDEASTGTEQVDIVSGNAYFVVYRQRISKAKSTLVSAAPAAAASAAAAGNGWPLAAPAAVPSADTHTTANDAQLAARLAFDGVDAVQVQLHPQLLQQLQQWPENVHQQVLQLHQEFEQACRKHTQMKQNAIARVEQRQQEVRSVHQLLQCPEDGLSSGRFLPKSWLEAWANSSAAPGPIDNGQLVCGHNSLKLDKPGLIKYVSKAAWEALVCEHKGGPELGIHDTCLICLADHLKGLVRSDHLQLLREELLACLAIDEQQQQDAATGVGYYVSKSWLAGFRRRDRIGGGSLQPPTAGITCCHGLLAPESLSVAAKRVLVSADSWDKLQELWVTQVMRELAVRREKTAKAAAAKALSAANEEADGVVLSDDDDDEVKIIDKAAAAPGLPDDNAAVQPQQQQAGGLAQQAVHDDNDDDALMHIDLAEHQEASLTEEGRIEQDDQQRLEQQAGSPAVAATLSWQFPLPLDGTVELSEQRLLDLLPVFHSVHAEECQQCAASLQEAAAGHETVKQQLEVQRAAFGKLLSGNVQEVLQPGATYYLVPNDWLAALRVHMSVASTRKPSSTAVPPAPPPLPEAIRALLCHCHPDSPGLVVPPPGIVNRRGRYSQSDPQADALRVVTQQDWQQLMLYHSHLQTDSTAADAQQAEITAAAQKVAPSTDSAEKRQSRGRGRASKQSQEQRQQHKQEQSDVLQQMVASMADIDPAFKGITAVLHLQADGSASTALAGNAGQQAEQQFGGSKVESYAQQAQACIYDLQHVANGQDRQQQDQWEHPTETEPQLQVGQQQQPMQLQQDLSDALLKQHTVRSEAMDVDVFVCSPLRPVPRSKQTPTTMQAQTAAAAAGAAGDGQLLGPLPAGVPAVAAAGGGGVDCVGLSSIEGQCSDVDGDPDGLLAAAQKDDEWWPGACEGRQLQGRPRKGAVEAGKPAAGACLAAVDSDDGASGPPAAVALRAHLVTQPGPCQAVLDARAAEMRAAMLVYSDAEVMVEVTQEADLSTAFNTAPGVERRSRRARKDRQPVGVSSTDTLAQLKLKVFEVLSIHPKNQRLYARSARLEGDHQTLAQLEVFPGEEIRVININEVPNYDYASVFDGIATGKRREMETGFRDTALMCGPSQAGPSSVAPGQVPLLEQPSTTDPAQTAAETEGLSLHLSIDSL